MFFPIEFSELRESCILTTSCGWECIWQGYELFYKFFSGKTFSSSFKFLKLSFYFQPIKSNATCMSGSNETQRWQHPVNSFIVSGDFVVLSISFAGTRFAKYNNLLMFSEEAVKKLVPRKHVVWFCCKRKGFFWCNEIALKGVECLKRKEEESRKITLEKIEEAWTKSTKQKN